MKFMKKMLLALMVLALTATVSIAKESAEETREDIAKHRTMAAAHEAAAKCLESGKDQAACNQELQAACKGLAIGKFCGMKHAH